MTLPPPARPRADELRTVYRCKRGGGTTLAARLTGETWSDALALGALVQAKGLMELIVLTILLDRRMTASKADAPVT